MNLNLHRNKKEVEEMLREQHVIETSPEFNSFKQSNPDAFFCSAFFVISAHDLVEEAQFNYYSPKTKQITTFSLPALNMKQEKARAKPEEIDTTQIKDIDEVVLKAKKLIKPLDKLIAILEKTRLPSDNVPNKNNGKDKNGKDKNNQDNKISTVMWKVTAVLNDLSVAKLFFDARTLELLKQKKEKIFWIM